MTDIVFLNLHRRYFNFEPTYGGFLGIYLLAAFVRRQGFDAKSFSGTLERGLTIIDELCSARSVAMVGLYCDFENVTENIFLSRHIKEKYELPVIVGGPQATALDQKFFTQSKCDAVVRYEGELTVLELMDYFLDEVGVLENIRGIAYSTVDEIKINPERPLIKNLDALPFIDEDCYLEPEHFYRGLSLMTGRGCPFRCAFCHEGTHTRAVRFRSIENIFAEIDAYLECWRARKGDEPLYIFFTDDTLTLEPNRLRRLCEGLAARRKIFEFNWFCEGHVHTLYRQPEMIEALASGGCYRIQLGIESGVDKILRAYGKQSTAKEIFEVVRRCRDAGIQQVYGNIILCGAHFDRAVFEAEKQFALKLIEEGAGVAEIGAVTYWPIAETPMTRRPTEFGLKIIDEEFITSAGDFPQVETNELDRLTIVEMHNGFERAIDEKMTAMLESRRIPTARIIGWLRHSRGFYLQGAWSRKLSRLPILSAYYGLIANDEGRHSSEINDLSTAHPLRVVPLYRHIRSIDEKVIEVGGERLIGEEIDVLLLTTGKLSVAGIAVRLHLSIERVVEVLLRLERRHFIVFELH